MPCWRGRCEAVPPWPIGFAGLEVRRRAAPEVSLKQFAPRRECFMEAPQRREPRVGSRVGLSGRAATEGHDRPVQVSDTRVPPPLLEQHGRHIPARRGARAGEAAPSLGAVRPQAGVEVDPGLPGGSGHLWPLRRGGCWWEFSQRPSVSEAASQLGRAVCQPEGRSGGRSGILPSVTADEAGDRARPLGGRQHPEQVAKDTPPGSLRPVVCEPDTLRGGEGGLPL
mmetsp:Transcript_21821/g.58319  ORF Transcript_21821/g.58319 Transcript_21821/m.58319 type:complete len:225 (+) Transcript_21821:476-1150(+)